MSAPKLCAAARVREQIVSILGSWGMDPEIVRTTAEVMVETDLAGVDSHGVSMLMDYEFKSEKAELKAHLCCAKRPSLRWSTPTPASHPARSWA
jgi:LDH2 family malate/lactate/ureidoglycolate dehydrogenase